jgi:purine-binding chemotaxis protein CheW
VEREHHEILIFEVAGQRHGLPVADVRELLRAVALTPLPRAPAVVEGLINLRGTLVPVLDLRSRFHLPSKPLEHTDHLIVARRGERLVALHIDRAVELVSLNVAEIEDAQAVLPGVAYVARVARFPEGLVLIHDLSTFLSHVEAAALEEALAAREGGRA